MSRPTGDVTNWMTMFRWIVKVIRDEYGIEEARLTRHAMLETELGLGLEQVEEVLGIIDESFGIRFPAGTLDEVLRLEELCMLASWLKGFYKRPDFISNGFEARCRATNALAA
ncbi:acyl carrier protein [Belnapia sp. T6]|uniref:Acyl carrier protein n=1 Tax=Belnapia mucosa TaxID=2804532 RepID=A0ABS1VCD0_9PROT|nr:acyl carrier protein [Belnapia mucosa]MBL6459341.1 acyl carrier protein [Belnapia mucosa]